MAKKPKRRNEKEGTRTESLRARYQARTPVLGISDPNESKADKSAQNSAKNCHPFIIAMDESYSACVH